MTDFKYLVFAKHKDNDKAFLFEASPYLPIKSGDFIEVETSKGIAEAECIGDAFFIENKGVQGLIQATGAYLPLKRVTAKVEYKITRSVNIIPDTQDGLPF
jgi:hypothetical protein